MLPELSPDARYPPGMAGTGGRGRPGRRLRRVDETSAGGLVVADDPITGPRAARGRSPRHAKVGGWQIPGPALVWAGLGIVAAAMLMLVADLLG